MPKAINIQVLGLKELEVFFQALPEKLEKNMLKRAMKDAGQIVLADAIFKAPVDTGALVASLVAKAFAGKGKVGIRIGVDSSEPYYASFNELGTKTEFGDVKTPARPFLRPALDDNEVEVINSISSNLAAALEKEKASNG